MGVFFLGAGASKSFYPTLPTARDLTLDYLLDPNSYSEWRSSPRPTNEIDYLRNYLGPELFAKIKNEPIEDVLDRFQSDPIAYRNLSIYLLKCLWREYTEDLGALVSWLKSVKQNCDAILTTNYDTVLERGIRRITKPRRVGGDRIYYQPLKNSGLIDFGVAQEKLACSAPKRDDAVVLLKLHGSMSWAFCQNCEKYNLHPNYAAGGVNAIEGMAECPHCHCSDRLRPVLVAPAKQKSYDDAAIKSIWARAQEVLERAAEIAFAGFSLNENDSHIRELLNDAHGKANTKRVIVVDRVASQLRQRYEAVYGRIVETQDQDWRQYLKANLKVQL